MPRELPIEQSSKKLSCHLPKQLLLLRVQGKK